MRKKFRKIYSYFRGTKTPGRLYFEELLKENREHIDGLVLNVGSGTRSYQELAQQMITIDYSPNARPSVICDITSRLPFLSNVFQSVICTSVLEHLPDTEHTISEMHRILVPGGSLIYFTPFMHKYHADPCDYWRFTKYGVERILNHFEIIKITPVGGKLSLILSIIRSSHVLSPINFFLFPIVKRLERHLSDNEEWALGFFAIARKVNPTASANVLK